MSLGLAQPFRCFAAVACVAAMSASLSADAETWTVAADQTSVRISVGKTGLLSVAGHAHNVIAPAVSGTVRFDPDRVEQTSIELTFSASALKVSEEGEPAKDVPEVQQTMLGPKVLDVEKYPMIVFRSREVTVRRRAPDNLQTEVAGDLTLHGKTRGVTAPVNVHVVADRLTGTGTMTIKQTDFGIEPVTAGLGAVRVKDEVSITFSFVARR